MTNWEPTYEHMSRPATVPNQEDYDEQQTDDEMPINFANDPQTMTPLITNFSKMLDYKGAINQRSLQPMTISQHQLPRPETAKYHRNDNEITKELRENVKYHKRTNPLT